MSPRSEAFPASRIGVLGALTISVLLLAFLVVPRPASASFGLNGFDVTFTNKDGTPATQAGSHPYALTTSFGLNYAEPNPFEWILEAEAKDLIIEQVKGMSGDATAVPKCSTTDFLNLTQGAASIPTCPNNTAVGAVAVNLIAPPPFFYINSSVYNLEPPAGVPVRLGFVTLGIPSVVDVGVKQSDHYNVVARALNLPQAIKVFGASMQLWGDPANPALDSLRGRCLVKGAENFPGFSFSEGEVNYGSFAEGECPATYTAKPFLTLPASCAGPQVTSYEADSWAEPGVWVYGSTVTHDDSSPPLPQGFTGCGKVPFKPSISALPTNASAESSTGLDFSLDFNDEGLTDPDGISESQTKKAVVTLPEGVTINPSVGEGLGFCSPADYQRETQGAALGEGCPESSKLGTLEVESPLVEGEIDGSLFLAQQDDPRTPQPGAENPFDTDVALYMVLRRPDQGIFVKIPAKVAPDPRTGQLVTTVDGIPELPFSHFNLHFREGQRAPLVTPPACGSYDIVAELTPWSDPSKVVTQTSSFEIESGVGQGPCPAGGVPPLRPEFEAGSVNNNAKSFSPFNMRLRRRDGEQDMTKFGATLPPGVLGKLAGVDECSEASIAAARAKTGREELASESCPANSQIGAILAGAGVGSALTYVDGKVYLAGPYKGAPLSVVVMTPAVAGPFDAGNVVTRVALTLNPETAEVEVDAASSDPIPHILKGIPLKVRDIRVYVDRENFILNPTSCDPSSARATLFGAFLDVFSDADDVAVEMRTRYQAANCLNLGFEPRLKLRLKGGTRRGAFPALRAVLRARPNDANIGSAQVTLPRSAFLEQAHIRTICTRVQFAAQECPKASIYGHARAFTPLLDEPVEGPVYLRSSDNKLPDMVAALKGLVDVNLVGRIDSFKGGIRSSFRTVPDAPVSKFVLTMQGGKKGLVVNSRNLCAGKNRATVRFVGQNGKASDSSPVVRPSCGGKRRGR
jgi:hypothetical protein